MGIGDSLFVTGISAWCVTAAGPGRAGRAMAWNGIAMYAALAAGAPVGTTLYGLGFGAVAVAAVLLPAAGFALTAFLPAIAMPRVGAPRSMLQVLGAIWAPGLAVTLASSGVGTIAAFLTLRYRNAGWPGAGFALSGFGIAYIAMRVFLAGLPDRLGGRLVAAVSLVVEAAGELLLWHAASPISAFAGAALTGLGYSLVFPSCGVEAMRRVGSDSRGLAIGVFLACFDLGLGAAGPLAGFASAWFGLDSAFLLGAITALLSAVLMTAIRLPKV